MALFGTLVFLIAASIVSSQEYLNQNQKENSKKADYKPDDIARILQAPLFRNNANLGGLLENPGYTTQSFDIPEPVESNAETRATSASYRLPAPSSVLLPPRVEASDTFAAHKTYPNQIKPIGQYQNVPSNNENFEATQNEHSLTPINYLPKYSRLIPNAETYLPINPLSKQLDLPLPNTPNVHFAKIAQPSSVLQTPLFEPYIPYTSNPQQPLVQYTPQNKNPYNVQLNPLDTLYSTPQEPKSEPIKATRVPTKYFPKKYNSNTDEFVAKKPLKNIPVLELADEDTVDISKIRKEPKFLKLTFSPDESQGTSDNANLDSYGKNQESEKQRHKFELAQKKILAKKENESKKQFDDKNSARVPVTSSEPVASESGFSNYHQGLENSFDSPSQHPEAEGISQVAHGAGGDRTEFQMHGQHGPHSYKFGYDTGKGKNRQFRFEERDNEGYVKGHYGYYDKHGKLQVVNYDAHPEHGFHAEGSFGKV